MTKLMRIANAKRFSLRRYEFSAIGVRKSDSDYVHWDKIRFTKKGHPVRHVSLEEDDESVIILPYELKFPKKRRTMRQPKRPDFTLKHKILSLEGSNFNSDEDMHLYPSNDLSETVFQVNQGDNAIGSPGTYPETEKSSITLLVRASETTAKINPTETLHDDFQSSLFDWSSEVHNRSIVPGPVPKARRRLEFEATEDYLDEIQGIRHENEQEKPDEKSRERKKRYVPKIAKRKIGAEKGRTGIPLHVRKNKRQTRTEDDTNPDSIKSSEVTPGSPSLIDSEHRNEIFPWSLNTTSDYSDLIGQLDHTFLDHLISESSKRKLATKRTQIDQKNPSFSKIQLSDGSEMFLEGLEEAPMPQSQPQITSRRITERPKVRFTLPEWPPRPAGSLTWESLGPEISDEDTRSFEQTREDLEQKIFHFLCRMHHIQGWSICSSPLVLVFFPIFMFF